MPTLALTGAANAAHPLALGFAWRVPVTYGSWSIYYPTLGSINFNTLSGNVVGVYNHTSIGKPNNWDGAYAQYVTGSGNTAVTTQLFTWGETGRAVRTKTGNGNWSSFNTNPGSEYLVTDANLPANLTTPKIFKLDGSNAPRVTPTGYSGPHLWTQYSIIAPDIANSQQRVYHSAWGTRYWYRDRSFITRNLGGEASTSAASAAGTGQIKKLLLTGSATSGTPSATGSALIKKLLLSGSATAGTPTATASLTVQEPTYLTGSATSATPRASGELQSLLPPFITQSVVVTEPSATRRTISWQPALNNPASYEVEYRAIGATDWVDGGDVTGALQKIISGLVSGTIYEARVRAENSVGTGPWGYSGFTTGYELLVDWDNDGTFGNAHADVFPRVTAGPIRTFTGRDLAAQRFARASTGTLSATLANDDGLLTNQNYASDLQGKIVPGRAVRLNLIINGTLRRLWTGQLDDMIPSTTRRRKTTKMRAFGPLTKIAGLEIDMPVINNQRTNYIITQLLTAGELSSGEIDVDSNVTTETISYWYPNTQSLRALLDQIELWEGGLIRETRDGKIRFDGQYYRQLQNRQATFTDQIASDGKIPVEYFLPSFPAKNIANRVAVNVVTLSLGSTAVMWTGPSNASEITSSQSLTLHAQADFDPGEEAITDWVTPVAGTDYVIATTEGGSHDSTQESNVTVQTTFFHKTALLSFTKTGGPSRLYIKSTQLRGKKLSINDDSIIIADEDTTSINTYGPKDWPTKFRFVRTQSQGRFLANIIMDSFANPHSNFQTEFDINISVDALIAAADLNLSDQVAIEGTSVSNINSAESYFVEAIEHTIQRGGHNMQVILASQLPITGGIDNVFVLNTSVLDTGRLGR